MRRIHTLSETVMQVLSERIGLQPGSAPTHLPPGVCQGIEALSRLFTRERAGLASSYLDEATLRRAYLSYYLPVNMAKVQALLGEIRPELFEVDPSRPLSVLDLGSGPGTAALGVCDWVSRTPAVSARTVDCVVVDRSLQALREGERLWNAYAKLVPLRTDRLVVRSGDLEQVTPAMLSPDGGNRRYDLIIAANVLGELFLSSRDPIRQRATLVRDCLEVLRESGAMILIEPALRDASRDLHRVRDWLLNEQACTVYSPCLHERPCPALVKDDDWCHEERPWHAPALVKLIDEQVGFVKDALKFSYLILRKDEQTIVPRAPGLYRVVSELREMKGEKRVWLCSEEGRPEVGRLDRARAPANAAFDHWHRGAIVKVEDIVRKVTKGRTAMVGRIPASAAVEVVRPVCGD